jgi:two-component system nitrogen regulation sensor histidine kinase NtrY
MNRRIPLRNNALAILAIAVGAVLLLIGIPRLLRSSRAFAPDFLVSAVLLGLTVLNLILLLILLFVLGRNLVRVLMERRRGVFGARLQMRLLLVFLIMAVGPSLLVLFVGSDLIQHTVDRWFNVDVERILSSSQTLGTALRESVAVRTRIHARVLAREIRARRLLDPAYQSRLRGVVTRRARELQTDAVNVFGHAGELVAVMNPTIPAGPLERTGSDPLAEIALLGQETEDSIPFASGELVRVAVPVTAADASIAGAVVVSTFLPGEIAGEVQEVERHYVSYQQARTFKEPIKALYVSLYVFPALLVLFGAVWLALYLSRRITTPVRLVASGAQRITAGERSVRLDFPPGNDEFATLITSFNRMSERLTRSEEEVEYSREGLSRKNQELEERQRVMETVLEAVGTGIVVTDVEGTTIAVNAAACRLLDIESDTVGRRISEVLKGAGYEEIANLAQRVLSGRMTREEKEIHIPIPSGERHMAVTGVPLYASLTSRPGAVIVLDDLSALVRAQRVAAWGEVARKLAHEIKNPLTPIQLSAQRIRKAYLRSAPDLEKIVTDATRTIVDEVEALRNLVDEFAHFARLPDVRPVPTDLHELIEQTLSLYDGLFGSVHFEREFSPETPRARLDPSQFKRVLINLVDNAIEAMNRKGQIRIKTEVDRHNGRLRLIVIDDGPGISEKRRDKLFVPHFSTKKRGSGLGLAVVSRILEEHHATIRVEANQPRGARFVIELTL